MTGRTDPEAPRAAMSIADMFEMGDDYKKASDCERDFLATKRSVADETIAKKASTTLDEVFVPFKDLSLLDSQTELTLMIQGATSFPADIALRIESYLHKTKAHQKFYALYWDINENKPSQSLHELMNLLTLDTKPTTLDAVVSTTQKAWIQKTRWDVKIDTPSVQALRPKILPLLQDLGLTGSISPQGRYDTALLLAGRANIFIARSHSLCNALKERQITVGQIDILVGTQPLHPSELEILKNCSLNICDVKTEKDMVQRVAEMMIKPLGIRFNIVATHLPDRKPNTEQTVHTWLETADQSGKRAIVVSDPQFATHQYLQCMEALFKKNITTIEFDLFSKQLDTADFEQLQISEEETQGSPILLYLDTIARILYTMQGQITKGYL